MLRRVATYIASGITLIFLVLAVNWADGRPAALLAYVSDQAADLREVANGAFVSPKQASQQNSSAQQGPAKHQLAAPTQGLPDLPSDYEKINFDDDWCTSNYGHNYLNHFRTHHESYCQEGSASTLECFRSNTNDQICIASGVKFNSESELTINRLSLTCNLRNFTHERGSASSDTTDPNQIQDIAEFYSYFGGSGAGPQLRDWQIAQDGDNTDLDCSAARNDGKTYLYLKREINTNFFHKINEVIQAFVSLDVLQTTINPTTNEAYLHNSRDDIELVVQDQDTFMAELWEAVTGRVPIPHTSLSSTCMGTVVLGLPGSSSRYWASVWGPSNCHDPLVLDVFTTRIYAHLNITPSVSHSRVTEETVVTIIDRKASRRLIGLNKFAARLQENYPKYTINVVDFAALTIKEQILVMQTTDVLIGIHGAGMTHLMWLPEHSVVGEILPPGLNGHLFRNMAKMRNLPYFHIHAQNSEEWNYTTTLVEKGLLRDLMFGNEVLGSAPVMPIVETQQKRCATDDEATMLRGKPLEQRNVKRQFAWQSDDIFLTNEQFQALADAAIAAQNNRGLRYEDVRSDTRALLDARIEV